MDTLGNNEAHDCLRSTRAGATVAGNSEQVINVVRIIVYLLF